MTWVSGARTLSSERIDVSHTRILTGVASGVALIFVAADGENMIGVASGANFRLTPDDVDRLPSSALSLRRRALGESGDPSRDVDPRLAARYRGGYADDLESGAQPRRFPIRREGVACRSRP